MYSSVLVAMGGVFLFAGLGFAFVIYTGKALESAAVSARLVKRASIAGEALVVELSDGRVMSVPIDWYPRLAHGTTEELSDWRVATGGQGIHWPRLDEVVSVEGLLAGRRSGESPASLARWLAARGNGRLTPEK